ncbi:MAG: hypothetical protein M1822_008720 [Bathelium mastoideum]|nr:MAG: hypothetical protein M1822_008720 [Bathelium mastoideum]
MADEKKTYDVEAGTDPVTEVEAASTEEVIVARELQHRNTLLHSLRRGEEWLDAKVGIETRGIDRIPDEERRPPSIWNIFFLWWSMNVHVGVLPLGLLGPQFGLSLRQSVAASMVGIVLGALCTAYTGTLGPKLGLRQVKLRRLGTPLAFMAPSSVLS